MAFSSCSVDENIKHSALFIHSSYTALGQSEEKELLMFIKPFSDLYIEAGRKLYEMQIALLAKILLLLCSSI